MAGIFSILKAVNKKDRPFCTCIVPAAGSATRMEGKDKMLEQINGIPVIQRTLMALEACPLIDEIIVVTREDLIIPIGALCVEKRLLKIKNIIKGGSTRTESVWLGINQADPKGDLIAVHDGARPFVSQELLEAVIREGECTGAAAPAVPVKDTVKIAVKSVVQETPDRSTLFAIQTPQVFDYGLFKGAMSQAIKENWAVTDDCSVVEKLGKQIALTPGSEHNIKVTTPIDLTIGEAICQWMDSE